MEREREREKWRERINVKLKLVQAEKKFQFHLSRRNVDMSHCTHSNTLAYPDTQLVCSISSLLVVSHSALQWVHSIQQSVNHSI